MTNGETSTAPHAEPCEHHHEHGTFGSDFACDTFVSQGFGPEGDWEHSRFCLLCGNHAGDHADPCEDGTCEHGRCSEHGCFPDDWCSACEGSPS